MNNLKVKDEAIGVSTYIKGIGMITIHSGSADLLLKHGKYQFLKGVVPPKKLVALSDKSVKELTELAKDLNGYSKKMKKDELIALIRDTSNA